MFIIKYKKIFFGLSSFLVIASIVSIVFFGLNLGIDFTGGSILEIEYKEERPELSLLENNFSELEITGLSIQPTGELGYILRMSNIDQDQKTSIDEALSFDGQYSFTEQRFSSIGPSLGQELFSKGLWAIALVVLLIIIFVAFAFAGSSKEFSSWKYGVATIVALAHDILIPVGLMAVLGVLYDLQIDALFLTALLAILGLSVNDTIVVFDRVRENLKNQKNNEPFDEVVGRSLEETFVRSINTSGTTVLVLLALFFLGGDTTKVFAGILALGMIVGTYSSLFLATPLLTVLKGGHKRG